MNLISFGVYTFTGGAQAMYDFIAEKVPWLTEHEELNDASLTIDNIKIYVDSTTIKITDIESSATIATPTLSTGSTNYTLLVTDSAFLISVGTSTSLLIGKSTDGVNEHYGAIVRGSSGNAASIITYNCLSAGQTPQTSLTSTFTTLMCPCYASNTMYNIENAYVLLMSPSSAYCGKIELDGNKYVQAGGMALQYTE